MTIIWITGGKGFIGRNLARHIARQGCIVAGIGHGLWPDVEYGKWSYSFWSNAEIEASNLSHLASVSGPPEIIYHLAGGSSVGASVQNPREDFRRTVESSSRLLEWVRMNTPQARVVCVSSAAVYGVGHPGKIPETAPLQPASPYGTHKLMMEQLCRLYAGEYGLQIAVARLFSVYGAGLEKQLIWDLCCKLADSRGKIVLSGTGEETRDWLHVWDAARLLWMIRDECSRGCPAINGGTGTATPIRKVAELVCRAWGSAPQIEFSGKSRAGDPTSLVADISRAAGLGFAPEAALPDGLLETIGWFRSKGRD